MRPSEASRAAVFAAGAALLMTSEAPVWAQNACEDLAHKAQMLVNGAVNCDSAVAQRAMTSCMVHVPFQLSGVAEYITSSSARQASRELARTSKSRDLQRCRLSGGTGFQPDSTNLTLPPGASERAVQQMLARIAPYLNEQRSPDSRCPDPDNEGAFFCSCPYPNGKPNCGVSCTGTCYAYGKKGLGGIDCSGLVAKGSPEYWVKSGSLPRDCPGHVDSCDEAQKTACPDLPPPNRCDHGTQQQLQLLKNDGRDSIENAQDFRAGDALYLKAGTDGRVVHVVQVLEDPSESCRLQSGPQVCKLKVVSAPSPGNPVHTAELTFVDGCVCIVANKAGQCVRTQCIAGGGTPL